MKHKITPEENALRRWAEQGVTLTAHVTVGRLNSLEVKRTVHEAPEAALRAPGGVWTDQRDGYTQLACRIELARRGPPQGWRDARVVGWVCYDVKEGWRPLLAGQEAEGEVY
jgi:hypothetical protein